MLWTAFITPVVHQSSRCGLEPIVWLQQWALILVGYICNPWCKGIVRVTVEFDLELKVQGHFKLETPPSSRDKKLQKVETIRSRKIYV